MAPRSDTSDSSSTETTGLRELRALELCEARAYLLVLNE